MAEGGAAAAMGNMNSNDNWMVHFRDTMRGGKFLNNFRMAELHAKEAPDRVWELETYGALFDRTKDGKISQRNFGGHEYPRLAHVGDRTGLELIRTLQQKIVSLQQEDMADLRRLRGAAAGLRRDHHHRADARRWTDRRRVRLLPRVGQAAVVRRARGHPGHRRRRQVVQGDLQLLGVHRGRSRARAAGRRHPDQHGVPAVPPDRHGLAAVGARDPGHRVGPRRRRGAEELRRQAVHVRLRAGRVPPPVRRNRGRGRPLVHRPGPQQATAGAAPPRRGGPGHQLRGQGRPGHRGRWGLPRHRLAPPGRVHPQAAALDVPPVQGTGRCGHHQAAHGDRADLPLRDGRGRGRRRQRGHPERARPVRGR